MWIDPQLLKKQARADDFADDDRYLEHLLEAAELWVCKAVNRSGDELAELGRGMWPSDIQHAALMLAAHWYNQREAVGGQMSEAPYAITALLRPYWVYKKPEL